MTECHLPPATVLANLTAAASPRACTPAGEGRGEEQRVRDVLFCRRRRGRRHSGDDDARRQSLHGRHVECVEQLNVSVRDRVDEFFRAPPSPVEQVDPTLRREREARRSPYARCLLRR